MRKRSRKPSLGAVVASRELCEIGEARNLMIVRLGKPRKVAGGDWICPYHITGLRRHKLQYAHGVDAIQALLMAIEGIRVALEESGKQFSWAGGEPGTGFTRFLPVAFGLGFERRLGQLVDREVERFARRAEAKSRRA